MGINDECRTKHREQTSYGDRLDGKQGKRHGTDENQGSIAALVVVPGMVGVVLCLILQDILCTIPPWVYWVRNETFQVEGECTVEEGEILQDWDGNGSM